jgi:glycine dehydrogenase subunit 1
MPYFALSPEDRAEMLQRIGVPSIDALFADVPPHLREQAARSFEELGGPQSELEISRRMKSLAARNTHAEDAACFLGAGLYDHFIPALIPALVGRGEFLTAYTPYQAESSQGTLQVIYEFQTLLCRLSEMEMANASLYDGATALAEAIILATTATRRAKVLVPRNLSPAYRRVARTYVQGLPIQIEEVSFDSASGLVDVPALEAALQGGDVAAVVLAQPNFFGGIEDAQRICDLAHAAGALLIAVFNPHSLGLLEAPGAYGADIAVGDGQPLGLSLTLGGPGLGIFCCRQKFARLAPGRLVGLSSDESGRRAFTLTLQTREQHIRREKATSNICSNQALCALTATIYMAAVGAPGMQQAASQSFHKAAFARQLLLEIPGVRPAFESESERFHEWALRLPIPVAQVNAALREHNIIGPYDLSRDYSELANTALFCCTEKRSRGEIEHLALALRQVLAGAVESKGERNGHHVAPVAAAPAAR